MPHTPGPWNDNGYFDHSKNRRNLACAVWTADNQKFICATRKDEPRTNDCSEEEQDANARLIAAAPDLLAALENLLRETSSGQQLCARKFVTEACDAITKAKGA